MTRRDRKEFILDRLHTCPTVFITREKDWGTTIGALHNMLDQRGMGAMLRGGEVLESVAVKTKDDLAVTIWYGKLEAHWEPFCAIIEFCGYRLGTYYDAI